MSGKAKSIIINFVDSCPFFSIYRDMVNGWNYVKWPEPKLKEITLTRHDPDKSTDSHLDTRKTDTYYNDPFGTLWPGVLEDYEASSTHHDSNKAISFYSLSINHEI